MQVSLLTPQQLVYQGEAQDILLIADKGEINILEKHADIITTVKAGPVRIKSKSGEKTFSVSDGVLRVEKDECSILCVSAMEAVTL